MNVFGDVVYAVYGGSESSLADDNTVASSEATKTVGEVVLNIPAVLREHSMPVAVQS